MVCSSENSSPEEPVTVKDVLKSQDLTLNDTLGDESGDSTHNNVVLSFAGGSIAVLVLLIIGFAGVKVYKAKFSRRRNFNYTLSEDNGNIVGDENRVNC